MNDLPKKGDLIAGKYTVEGVLGQGGMGAVFEVCHRLTGKRFAVKWLLPSLASQSDAVRRFMREAQVAGRVDHPNVVTVYDVGQEGNSFFMVMELLQGEPLGKRLDRVRRLSVEESCRILIPVMHGLSVAHAAGVIHRDLKPDNLFLCRTALGTEAPKVLDFGISKMSPLANEVNAGMTRIGLAIGTPQYMSPEQLRGEAAVDLRTDVYALGVILYEMLGGQQPFPNMSFPDLVLNIMHIEPPKLTNLAPGLPPKLVEIISRAMSRDVNVRFPTVEALGRALVPFAGGMPFAADTGDPTRMSNTRQSRVSSQDRLLTPFGTEVDQRPPSMAPESNDEVDFQREVRGNLPMVAGVGIAAAAVLALGAAAYMLATQGSQNALLPLTGTQAGAGTSPNTGSTGTSTDPGRPGTGTEPVARDPVPQQQQARDPEPEQMPIELGPDLPGSDGQWAAHPTTQQPSGSTQNIFDPSNNGIPGQDDANRIRLGAHGGGKQFPNNADARRAARKARTAGRGDDDANKPLAPESGPTRPRTPRGGGDGDDAPADGQSARKSRSGGMLPDEF